MGFFYRQEKDPLRTDGSLDIQRDNLLGVDLSFPLPLFNRRSGEIMEATAERSIARGLLEALEQTVRREVAETTERVRLATDTLTIYERELNRLSQQNLADIERAFEAGEVGALEVLRAQDDFAEVTEGYHEAVLEYREAAAELDAAVGPGTPESERPSHQEEN